MPVAAKTKKITQLRDIKAERVDGVETPANGTPFLLMKAVNAVGGVDEKPDIDGAEQILQLLARLIQSEAAEMAVGNFDESWDIQTLLEATSLVRCFLYNEQAGNEDDGEALTKELAGEVCKRKFSAADRKRLASDGKALGDGSYPIPDADALRRAAILARSGHGDVAAAKKLIARRAKELGVANPLASDASKDAPETPETEAVVEAPEPQETEKSEDKPDLDDLVKSAVAEAVKAHEGRLEALKGELEVLKQTPIPGGPFITAPARKAEASDLLVKAAECERSASLTGDRELAAFYTRKAAELRAQAA